MKIQRSAILSVTFITDALEHKTEVVITAHVIPEKQAYVMDSRLVEKIESKALVTKNPKWGYRQEFLENVTEMERMPEWDLKENAPEHILKRFENGFYSTEPYSDFYGGFGITGFFLGLLRCEIVGGRLKIDDSWRHRRLV